MTTPLASLGWPLGVALVLACTPATPQAKPAAPARPAERAPRAAASDFAWDGKIAAGGRVQVSSVLGDVRIVAVPGDTVRVRATKSGKDAARVRIDVDSSPKRVRIRPVYPERDNVDARVDFVMEVPASVEVSAEVVNGDVTAKDVAGGLDLHAVDGDIVATGCADVRGKTVNGRVRVTLPKKGAKRAQLEAVNGGLAVAIAPGIGAHVLATTLNGTIDSVFPLDRQTGTVGTQASLTLGDGSVKVEMSTVNGGIELRKP